MKVWLFHDVSSECDHEYNLFGSKDAAVRYVMDLYSAAILPNKTAEAQLKDWAENAIEECEVRDY